MKFISKNQTVHLRVLFSSDTGSRKDVFVTVSVHECSYCRGVEIDRPHLTQPDFVTSSIAQYIDQMRLELKVSFLRTQQSCQNLFWKLENSHCEMNKIKLFLFENHSKFDNQMKNPARFVYWLTQICHILLFYLLHLTKSKCSCIIHFQLKSDFFFLLKTLVSKDFYSTPSSGIYFEVGPDELLKNDFQRFPVFLCKFDWCPSGILVNILWVELPERLCSLPFSSRCSSVASHSQTPKNHVERQSFSGDLLLDFLF